MDRKLKNMQYANAFIRRYENKDGNKWNDILVSYTSFVAECNSEGWIYCNGLYSATTRKHISSFAREYGLSYYDFKYCYENHVRYNRYTGEIQDVDNLEEIA